MKYGMCSRTLTFDQPPYLKKFQNQAGQSSTVPTSISSCWWWGSEMVASNSTFRPHPGRVIRLHAVRHGTEALSTAIIQGKLQPSHIWP